MTSRLWDFLVCKIKRKYQHMILYSYISIKSAALNKGLIDVHNSCCIRANSSIGNQCGTTQCFQRNIINKGATQCSSQKQKPHRIQLTTKTFHHLKSIRKSIKKIQMIHPLHLTLFIILFFGGQIKLDMIVQLIFIIILDTT